MTDNLIFTGATLKGLFLLEWRFFRALVFLLSMEYILHKQNTGAVNNKSF